MSIDQVTMEELATETARRSLRPLRVAVTVEGTIAAVAGPIGLNQLQVGQHVVAVVTQPERRTARIALCVPLSQLVSFGAIDTREPGTPVSVKAFVGKRMRLRVLEVDPSRGRLRHVVLAVRRRRCRSAWTRSPASGALATATPVGPWTRLPRS